VKGSSSSKPIGFASVLKNRKGHFEDGRPCPGGRPRPVARRLLEPVSEFDIRMGIIKAL
jgi:hypothetical protein